MKSSTPPSKNLNKALQAETQKMGIILFVLGIIIFGISLTTYCSDLSIKENGLNIFLSLFGAVLTAAGFYTWKNGK